MGSPQSSATVGVALLAAGASRRMGRPKLLLPWEGTTIIGHLIDTWQRVAAQVVVVCAEGDAAMTVELDRLVFPASHRITNPEPERGMFSSIQCAAHWNSWCPNLTHCAIALGDQPLIRAETLQSLLAFATKNPVSICQPRRNGRGRHPVVLPITAWRHLAAFHAGTLHDFLRQSAANIRFLEIDDPGVEIDFDTPADYTPFRHSQP